MYGRRGRIARTWDGVRYAWSDSPVMFLVILAAVLLTLFAGTEIVFGTTRSQASQVMGHVYVPAYTTPRTCDNKGNCSGGTYHPPEYRLGVTCGGSVHDFDAGRRAYYASRDGQWITVAHRDGPWTGIH